jgi:hypothetical protein
VIISLTSNDYTNPTHYEWQAGIRFYTESLNPEPLNPIP